VDSGSVQSVAKFLQRDCMQMFLKEETPVEQLVRNRNRPLTDIRVVLRIRTHDSQESKNGCLNVKHGSQKNSLKVRGTGSGK
jgi:hypothetical protein